MFHILLDTEAFRHENLNFSSDKFETLAHFVREGHAKIYVTDVVLGELERALEESVGTAVARLRSNDTRRTLGILVQTSRAALSGILDKLDEAALTRDLAQRLDELLTRLGAVTISTDGVSVAELRSRYFEGIPPFSALTRKKHEFPDALSVLAAEAHAKRMQIDLHVVSVDKGIAEACSASAFLQPVDTLAKMINKVFATIEATKAFAEAADPATTSLRPSLVEAVRDRFAKSAFYVEDEWDGEVSDVGVLDVDLGEPAVVGVDGNVVTLSFVATIQFTATLTVADPSQSAYDSETKEVMVFGYLRRTVQEEAIVEGSAEIVVDAETLEETKLQSLSLLREEFTVPYPWSNR